MPYAAHPISRQLSKGFYFSAHPPYPGVIQIFLYLGKMKVVSAPVLTGVLLAHGLSAAGTRELFKNHTVDKMF